MSVVLSRPKKAGLAAVNRCKSIRLKTACLLFIVMLSVSETVFAEDAILSSNENTTLSGDGLTQMLDELNVYDNGFYHPEDEDLLKYNIRSAAENKASVKALDSLSPAERGEVARSLRKSMDLLNGVDSDGVYYFPGK